MANMFSGNVQKEVPKSIKECIKPDAVSTNLWIWCERLELLGKILFWIIIIFGSIFAITVSVVEETKGTYYTYTETSFDFEVFLTNILQTAIYAFIEYCTYHVLALLVGALASIVQNTKISANIALFNNQCDTTETETDTDKAEAYTSSKTEEHKNKYYKRYWICGKCEVKNSNRYNECWVCGNPKESVDDNRIHDCEETIVNEKPEVGHSGLLDVVWICSKCNSKNNISRSDCWNCGNPKE